MNKIPSKVYSQGMKARDMFEEVFRRFEKENSVMNATDFLCLILSLSTVPSNIQAIQDQNVTEGENLTLTCTASGMPQPKVSWIKPNGQSIAGNVLKFVNMNRSEAGKYKCEASNECGYATEMATIDVQCE